MDPLVEPLRSFADWSEDHRSCLIGSLVTHKTHGSGQIQTIDARYISVRFLKAGMKSYQLGALGEHFTDVVPCPERATEFEIASEAEQKRVERAAQLAREQEAERATLEAPLKRRLERLESGRIEYLKVEAIEIQDHAIKLLDALPGCDKGAFHTHIDYFRNLGSPSPGVLRFQAEILEKAHGRYKDPWLITRASACWRRAKRPAEALRVTEPPLEDPSVPSDAASALRTTRAAAFLDLGDYGQALASAEDALRLSPQSYHALRVKGAALVRLEQFAEAEECFRKAADLDHKRQEDIARQVRAEFESALKDASPEEKQRAATYLAEKYPMPGKGL